MIQKYCSACEDYLRLHRASVRMCPQIGCPNDHQIRKITPNMSAIRVNRKPNTPNERQMNAKSWLKPKNSRLVDLGQFEASFSPMVCWTVQCVAAIEQRLDTSKRRENESNLRKGCPQKTSRKVYCKKSKSCGSLIRTDDCTRKVSRWTRRKINKYTIHSRRRP